MNKITFKPVNNGDIGFLYNLFLERLKYPKEIRITQEEMPSYKKHSDFVGAFINNDHPYQSWDIIYYNDVKVGSLALKKDGEWGYHILMEYWGKGIGQSALSYLIMNNPSKTLIARIKPDNEIAKHIAQKFGHKLDHLTFVRLPDEVKK